MALGPFSVSADHFNLTDLVQWVASEAAAHEWDDDLVMRVNLVLEELCLNVRSYGSVEGRRIHIEFASDPVRVGVQFVDGGLAFDPVADAPSPDLSSPLCERRAGGLGLLLVREMADRIEYRRVGTLNCLDIELLRCQRAV